MGSLRQSSSEDLEKLLDGMLAEVERELPAWSSIALPFPLPSYRSKLGTVKRMLAALLDGEDLPRRRRSAIFQLAKQVRTVFLLSLSMYVKFDFRQLNLGLLVAANFSNPAHSLMLCFAAAFRKGRVGLGEGGHQED
jgi:hypothetical protein